MSGSRLLLVDDDRTFRLSTAALLRQDGHEVSEAADGQRAVELLEVDTFDLILLDLKMPGLDGVSVVEVLRKWGHDTPILMISGFGTVDTAVDALQRQGARSFLDEIGDVSPGMQHRLLRVLQERELTPVGAVRPVKVDVRIVAATNRDLRAEVESGRFRDDLYYRLHVVRIEVPPLRARREDIPLVAEAFYARVERRPHSGCSPLAMRLLQAYPWPGNVRELLAVLESSHINAGTRRIEAQHLPANVRDPRGKTGESGERYRRASPVLDERAAIAAALAETGGTRNAAADHLGMSRTTLWRKMREYGLEGTDDT